MVEGFTVATIDYETDDDERRIVECKVVGSRVAHHWTDDECPAYVQIQTQWQMGLLGRKRADVAVLQLGFTDFSIYSLEFNPELYSSLLEIGQAFWMRVQEGEPLRADESEACRQALLERYKWKRLELAPAPPQFGELVTLRRQLKNNFDSIEKTLKTVDNEIREAIGEGSGFWGDFGRVTHKEDCNGKRSLKFFEPKKPRKGTRA